MIQNLNYGSTLSDQVRSNRPCPDTTQEDRQSFALVVTWKWNFVWV